MVTFDSPLYRCEQCGEFVLLDQTVRECADEHRCRAESCPVAGCFDEMEVSKKHANGKKTGHSGGV